MSTGVETSHVEYAALGATVKTCCVCGLAKSLDDFYQRSDSSDGYRNNCISCHLTRHNSRYTTIDACAKRSARNVAWRLKNIDRLREAWRAKYAATHIRMKRSAISVGQWHNLTEEERKKRHSETTRLRHAEHPEIARRGWRNQGPKKRARKRAAFVEFVDSSVVFARDKGICGICKIKVRRQQKWHMDHIIPLVRGGTHCYVNVQVAHDTCNLMKHDKMPTGQLGLFQRMVRE